MVQIAKNKKTGEVRAQIGDNWYSVSQLAVNKRTGERRGLIGGQWFDLGNVEQENALERVPIVGDLAAGVADIGLKAVSGLTGVTKSLTDLAGADNPVSGFLQDVTEGAEGLTSSEARQEARQSAYEMKEAEGKGLAAEAGAAVKAFARSPLDYIAQGAGSAIPFVGAVLAGGAPAALALGAASGAGTIKGSIYSAVKEELTAAQQPKTEAELAAIERVAEEAQGYAGGNLDQMALGAAIGALAGATGFSKSVANIVGKRAAARVVAEEAGGVAADAATQATARTAAKEAAEARLREGLGKTIAKSAAVEAAPEFLQAGQEKVAQNIALQREGMDVPTFQGALGQATLEGLVGGVLGPLGGVAERGSQRRADAAFLSAVGEQEKREAILDKAEELSASDAPDKEQQFFTYLKGIGLPDVVAAELAKVVLTNEELARSGGQRETDEDEGGKEDAVLQALNSDPEIRLQRELSEAAATLADPDAIRAFADEQELDEDAAFELLNTRVGEIQSELAALRKAPEAEQVAAIPPADTVTPQAQLAEQLDPSPPPPAAVAPAAPVQEAAPVELEEVAPAPSVAPTQDDTTTGEESADVFDPAALEEITQEESEAASLEGLPTQRELMLEELADLEAQFEALPAKGMPKARKLARKIEELKLQLRYLRDRTSQVEAAPVEEEVAPEAAAPEVSLPEALQGGPTPAEGIPATGATAPGAEEVAPAAEESEYDKVERERPFIMNDFAQASNSLQRAAAIQQEAINTAEVASEEHNRALRTAQALRALADIEFALRMQDPANAAYTVSYAPGTTKPYRLMADGRVVLSEGKLEKFQSRVYGEMQELTPYGGPVTPAAKVEETEEEEPTVATQERKKLATEIDNLRQQNKITDAERAELLAMLVMPDTISANGRASPEASQEDILRWQKLKAVQQQEAAVRQTLTDLRAGNNNAKKIAEAMERLNIQNDQLQRAFDQLARPVRERAAKMTKSREGKQRGAKSALQKGQVQQRLGQMDLAEGKVTQEEVNKAGKKVRDARVAANQLRVTARAQSTADPDPSPEEAALVQKGLEGKTAEQAIRWLAENAPNPSLKAIAAAIEKKMQVLAKLGFQFGFQIVSEDGQLTPEGDAALENARGFAYVAPDQRLAQVALNSASRTGRVGTSFEVALHEFLHVATIPYIRLAEALGREADADTRRLLADLRAVFTTAQFELLKRMGNKKDGAALTPFEQKLADEDLNSLENIAELVSWALTNPDMQAFLETVPYKSKQSMLGRLFEIFREWLGLSPKEDTALAEVFRISEAIMSVPEARIDAMLRSLGPAALATPTMAQARNKKKDNDTKPATAEALMKSGDKQSEGLRKAQNSLEAAQVVDGLSENFKARRDGPLVDAFKQNAAVMSLPLREFLLGAFPTSALVNLNEADIPAIRRLVGMLREMHALKNGMINAANDIAGDIDKFIRKHGDEQMALAMTAIRINETAPADYKSRADELANDPPLNHLHQNIIEAEKSGDKRRAARNRTDIKKRERQINDSWDLWEALGKQEGGQELYREIRDYYRGVYLATRAYQDKLIESLPDADNRRLLLTQVRRDMETLNRESREKDEDAPDVPDELFPKDYFPFTRFGRYFLRISEDKKTGRDRAFYTFESPGARLAFQKARAKKLGVNVYDGETFQTGVLNDYQEAFDMQGEIMRRVFEVLQKAKESSGAKEVDLDNIIGDIYQLYLLSLPERSIRRQFLRSENVEGMSMDVLRTFSARAASSANQISKLAYARDIYRELEAAEENAAVDKTKPSNVVEREQQVITEIGKRVTEELNPTAQSTFINIANRLTFTFFLTNAATAFTNFVSLPVRVLPRLWRDFGYVQGSALFGKYLKLWDTLSITEKDRKGNEQFAMPNVGMSAMLRRSPVLQRALAEAHRRGVVQTSTDVMVSNEREESRSRKGVGTRLWDNTNWLMSLLFNTTENITSQMAFLMAFDGKHKELTEKNKPSTPEEREAVFNAAVDYAEQIKYDTIGDYSSIERPRLFKQDWLRAVFLFKMYALKQTQFVVGALRDIFRMKKVPLETRVDALKELVGVSLMAGLFGGLAGMPLYSVLVAGLEAIIKATEDDEERYARMERNAATGDNFDMLFRYDILPSIFGEHTIRGIDGREHRLSDVVANGPLSELTNVNIGSRTSLDLKNMWFREGIQGDTAQETAINLLVTNIAPLSMFGNFFKGYDVLQKSGDISRAIETMAPAFFKSWLTADRLDREGATTTKGVPILAEPEFTDRDIVAQTVGYQPTNLSKTQQQRIAIQRYMGSMEKERAKLYDRLAKAAFAGEILPGGVATTEEGEELLQDVREFNDRVPVALPELFIVDIGDSLRSRAKQLYVRGVPVSKKNAAAVSEAFSESDTVE